MKRFHRRSRRLCILAALLVLLVLFLRQNVLPQKQHQQYKQCRQNT